ncbi:MAG: sulfur oxidation c-type cytochrome SoxA [Rubrivivax sp.]|nr:sulfur oxidation c-type cytochrome SoxA [Rubrivivax sp.]
MAVLAALIGVLLGAGCAQPRPEPAGQTQTDPRRSGYHFMSRATQALQDDDAQNPAFLWVAEGRRRFALHCAGCHAEAGLRDAATRHPAFDAQSGRPLRLEDRVRHCHRQRLMPAGSGPDEDAVLADLSHLAFLARGLPIQPPDDPRLAAGVEQGRLLWHRRLGQLDLSCADCHDRLAGRRLAGSTIPQAHPTGYPVYRLEWQTLGTLERRLRGCLSGIRAQPFAPGAPEWVALELFLRHRAAGLSLDAPGVRP